MFFNSLEIKKLDINKLVKNQIILDKVKSINIKNLKKGADVKKIFPKSEFNISTRMGSWYFKRYYIFYKSIKIELHSGEKYEIWCKLVYNVINDKIKCFWYEKKNHGLFLIQGDTAPLAR